MASVRSAVSLPVIPRSAVAVRKAAISAPETSPLTYPPTILAISRPLSSPPSRFLAMISRTVTPALSAA